MDYQVSDALVMIGELHYQKRMLEEQVKVLSVRVGELESELEDAKTESTPEDDQQQKARD